MANTTTSGTSRNVEPWHNDHHHIDVGNVHLLLNPADPNEMDIYLTKLAQRDGISVEQLYIKHNLDPSDSYQMFNFVINHAQQEQDARAHQVLD